MTTEQKIIAKYKELVELLDDELENNFNQSRGYKRTRKEIAALETQLKEQEEKPRLVVCPKANVCLQDGLSYRTAKCPEYVICPL